MTALTRPLRAYSPHPSKASRSSFIVYLFSSLRPGSPSPRLCWLQLLFWTPRLSCRSKNSQSEPGLFLFLCLLALHVRAHYLLPAAACRRARARAAARLDSRHRGVGRRDAGRSPRLLTCVQEDNFSNMLRAQTILPTCSIAGATNLSANFDRAPRTNLSANFDRALPPPPHSGSPPCPAATVMAVAAARRRPGWRCRRTTSSWAARLGNCLVLGSVQDRFACRYARHRLKAGARVQRMPVSVGAGGSSSTATSDSDTSGRQGATCPLKKGAVCRSAAQGAGVQWRPRLVLAAAQVRAQRGSTSRTSSPMGLLTVRDLFGRDEHPIPSRPALIWRWRSGTEVPGPRRTDIAPLRHSSSILCGVGSVEFPQSEGARFHLSLHVSRRLDR